MTKKTCPESPREILESRIGEKGMQNLRKIAGALARREKLFMRVKDSTLINPAIEELKQIIRREEQRVGIEEPMNFSEVDFRKKGSKAWLEELTQLLGRASRELNDALTNKDKHGNSLRPEEKVAIENARKHIEHSRLILIDPGSDEGKDDYEAMDRISLYAKYGMGTLALVSRIKGEPDSRGLAPGGVIRTLGGDLDRTHYLDYYP